MTILLGRFKTPPVSRLRAPAASGLVRTICLFCMIEKRSFTVLLLLAARCQKPPALPLNAAERQRHAPVFQSPPDHCTMDYGRSLPTLLACTICGGQSLILSTRQTQYYGFPHVREVNSAGVFLENSSLALLHLVVALLWLSHFDREMPLVNRSCHLFSVPKTLLPYAIGYKVSSHCMPGVHPLTSLHCLSSICATSRPP